MSAGAGDFAFGVSIQCGPTPASAGAGLPDETGYRGKNGSRNDVFTCVERQEEPKCPNQQRDRPDQTPPNQPDQRPNHWFTLHRAPHLGVVFASAFSTANTGILIFG